jgi:hypothetical protein
MTDLQRELERAVTRIAAFEADQEAAAAAAGAGGHHADGADSSAPGGLAAQVASLTGELVAARAEVAAYQADLEAAEVRSKVPTALLEAGGRAARCCLCGAGRRVAGRAGAC